MSNVTLLWSRCGAQHARHRVIARGSSYWIMQVVVVMTVLVGAVPVHGNGGPTDPSLGPNCPDRYWEGPVRNCLNDLTTFISKDNAHMPKSQRDERTCSLWQSSRSCMYRLIEDCPGRAKELRELLNAHSHVTVPCYTDRTKKVEDNTLCYRPLEHQTRTCIEPFDMKYNDLIVAKSYQNACRVLSTVIRCLHSKKMEIQKKCTRNGAEQYHREYIDPIVSQVDQDVKRICRLNPPLDHYLNQAAHLNKPSNSSTIICWSFAAMLTHLLVIHWNTWVT